MPEPARTEQRQQDTPDVIAREVYLLLLERGEMRQQRTQGRSPPARKAALSSEEGVQLRIGLIRRFLGEIVAAVKRPTPHVVGPVAPDRQHIVPGLQLAIAAPEGEHGANDAPLPVVRLVVGKVDGGAGSVVLAHSVDGFRIADAAEVVLECFRREETSLTQVIAVMLMLFLRSNQYFFHHHGKILYCLFAVPNEG